MYYYTTTTATTAISGVWSKRRQTKTATKIIENNNNAIECLLTTRSSAVAERPRDASCLSVVSFNIPSAQLFLLPITVASDLLVHKILLWLGYPMVKNLRRYRYSFWRNSRTWQPHRQTDGRTDTAWQHRPRLCIASRGINVQRKSCEFRFIRGFYVSISIRNILEGNLQPKLKVASVWPKSTAVITGIIFTCPGRAWPVFRLHRGLVYFARIALWSSQHAMEPYIRSESRLAEGRTLDTSLKLTTSTV